MKLLVKAYGKKNIAELTPKKVLVTPKNKKPYWMTTYARTGEKDEKNSRAWTKQLLRAIADEDPKRIREAVEHGANVDAKVNSPPYPTALHFAVRKLINPDKGLTKFLLEHGANPNIKDHFGMTPLFYATELDTVKELVEHGADVNIQNDKGETALDLAIRSGYTDVANLLQSYGAKEASEIEKPSTIPEGKVLIVKNEELTEPFCYKGLDENGDWYGVGDYDPDKIIPGEVVITSEGWIYWKGDYSKGDSAPLNDRPLTEDEMGDFLEMIGHPGYPSARLVDLDDEDEW